MYKGRESFDFPQDRNNELVKEKIIEKLHCLLKNALIMTKIQNSVRLPLTHKNSFKKCCRKNYKNEIKKWWRQAVKSDNTSFIILF